jgi:hypothetical protein
VLVTRCGRICIGNRKINLSTVFAGQLVGIREVADKTWIVSFLDFDLGFFDEVAARVEPGANPFASKVLTMCPVGPVKATPGQDLLKLVAGVGFEPTTFGL